MFATEGQTLSVQARLVKTGDTMLASSTDEGHSGLERIPGTVTSVRTEHVEGGEAVITLSTGDTLTYDNYQRVMVFRPFSDLREQLWSAEYASKPEI